MKRFILVLLICLSLASVAEANELRAEMLEMRTIQQKEYTSRIVAINSLDDYLSGSPLEGYGEVFYDNAIQYGINYKLSPAISCIESGKGKHCFRSHNAWGWGKVNWSSWEEAIEGHIKGIAKGYGNISPQQMNKSYCPPNKNWGNKVQAEMDRMR